MPLHKSIAIGDVHVPHNWEYADQATREAATGFVTGDLWKLARQTDDNSLWMLTAVTPTWKQIDVGGPPATHGSTHKGDAADPVPNVDAQASGLMTSADKAKLDGLFSEYDISGDDTETNSQSQSWVLKHRHNMPAGTSGGSYKLSVSLGWSTDDVATDFKARLYVDGADVEWEFTEQPPTTYASGHRGVASGFTVRNLTSGAHTVDIEYCIGGANKTAYIRNAFVEVCRVGPAA